MKGLILINRPSQSKTEMADLCGRAAIGRVLGIARLKQKELALFDGEFAIFGHIFG
jgi:hypothetical protein